MYRYISETVIVDRVVLYAVKFKISQQKLCSAFSETKLISRNPRETLKWIKCTKQLLGLGNFQLMLSFITLPV